LKDADYQLFKQSLMIEVSDMLFIKFSLILLQARHRHLLSNESDNLQLADTLASNNLSDQMEANAAVKIQAAFRGFQVIEIV
jgi:hypothetical protein